MNETFDQRIRSVVVQAAILRLIGQGFSVGVGGRFDNPLFYSSNPGDVLGAIPTSGQSGLYISCFGRGCGWVDLDFNRDPWAVIGDSSSQIEHLIAPVRAMAAALEPVFGSLNSEVAP